MITHSGSYINLLLTLFALLTIRPDSYISLRNLFFRKHNLNKTFQFKQKIHAIKGISRLTRLVLTQISFKKQRPNLVCTKGQIVRLSSEILFSLEAGPFGEVQTGSDGCSKTFKSPFSSYTRCCFDWIDGKLMFSTNQIIRQWTICLRRWKKGQKYFKAKKACVWHSNRIRKAYYPLLTPSFLFKICEIGCLENKVVERVYKHCFCEKLWQFSSQVHRQVLWICLSSSETLRSF